MKTITLSEQKIVNEAVDILLHHMEPAKVARFLSTWQWDGKNYSSIRERIFKNETVESLSSKIHHFEQRRRK